MHNENKYSQSLLELCCVNNSYPQSQLMLLCRQLCHIHSQRCIYMYLFPQQTLCGSWNTNEMRHGKLSDAQIEFAQRIILILIQQCVFLFLLFVKLIWLLTSSICSPVESSYLVWNLSLSEIVPLALLHDTSGLGSPFTKALKIANFPR